MDNLSGISVFGILAHHSVAGNVDDDRAEQLFHADFPGTSSLAAGDEINRLVPCAALLSITDNNVSDPGQRPGVEPEISCNS